MCSAIAMTSSGADRTTPTQKRRDISASSGLPSSPAVGVIGSSAMPQIGQLPGPSRTISGCIGQVHMRPRRSRRRRRRLVADKALGFGDEPLAAARAAEEIFAAGVFGAVARRGRIDAHPADRIDRVAGGRRPRSWWWACAAEGSAAVIAALL